MEQSADVGSPQYPTTVAELVEQIQYNRAELEKLLYRFGEDEMASVTTENGWTIKDHLAHIVGWEGRLLAGLRGEAGHQWLGVDEASYKELGVDGINATIYQRSLGRPISDALADFRQSYQTVLAEVARLKDADLGRPFDPLVPDDGMSLSGGIVVNTSGHYAEHVEWLSRELRS